MKVLPTEITLTAFKNNLLINWRGRPLKHCSLLIIMTNILLAENILSPGG